MQAGNTLFTQFYGWRVIMELHQLYIFTKVVEQKSFSKAAEALYLSQSTVSSHIQSLEKYLGVPLFDRLGRENILTPYGERLYDWALKLLQLRDEALLDIKKSADSIGGVIRIGVSSVPAQCIVPKMIKKFRDRYSQVTFSIHERPSKSVAEHVLNGTVDLGILGEKYGNERLRYIPLLKEKLVLFAGKEFQIQTPVTAENLSQYPFIMRYANSGTKAILEKFFRKHGMKESDLNIVAYTDSGETLIELVKQGVGVSIISEIAATEYADNPLVQIHPIEGFDDERYFYLVYNEKKTLSMPAKLFLKMFSNQTFVQNENHSQK